MIRKFMASGVALLLLTGFALAQDEKGKDKGKGKGMRIVGTVKKFDAAAGTLTVATKSKKDSEGTDEEFRVSDATRFIVFGNSADDKKEMSGKEGLKELKDGVRIAVMHSNGKVTEVIVNPMGRKKADK